MAAQDGHDAKGRRTRGTAWVVAQFALLANRPGNFNTRPEE